MILHPPIHHRHSMIPNQSTRHRKNPKRHQSCLMVLHSHTFRTRIPRQWKGRPPNRPRLRQQKHHIQFLPIFDNTDESLYHLYTNHQLTRKTWFNYLESREYPHKALRNRNRWESKSFDAKLIFFKRGKDNRKTDHPVGLSWHYQHNENDVICRRYCKNKTEEEALLQYIRKSHRQTSFSDGLIELVEDRNILGDDKYLTRVLWPRFRHQSFILSILYPTSNFNIQHPNSSSVINSLSRQILLFPEMMRSRFRKSD
jgi:hypothetical protein